jgi:DNA polymerase-3 subunit gamma/tau
MFYLKYRPKTIAEIDNSNVRDSFRNILNAKNLPHAFLFIGQKGTGKTSTARIFAKSVNCLNNKFAGKGESVEPCNSCANCKSIEASSSPDVMEMDAASNRGIEEVKNLIKESAFSPLTSRYRVFIIDEAHMITTEAFNALLKTLEEPPPTVIFVLATTNEEKVPKTITSRCFKVNFGFARKEDIKTMLKRITNQEKLEISEELIDLIASHAEKSFRDTTKMLEELVIQDKLTTEAAFAYLGMRSRFGLLESLQNKPLKDTLAWVEEFSKTGGSVKHLIEELLEELRMGLLQQNGIKTESDVKITLSTSDIAVFMKLLHEAYNTLRFAPIESLPLEIAIVEFYNRKQIKV